ATIPRSRWTSAPRSQREDAPGGTLAPPPRRGGGDAGRRCGVDGPPTSCFLTMADEHLIDNEALSRSLRHLRRETPQRDLGAALQAVIGAARDLFSATGAGLMLIDDTSMLRFVAATDEPGRLLELRQEEIG